MVPLDYFWLLQWVDQFSSAIFTIIKPKWKTTLSHNYDDQCLPSSIAITNIHQPNQSNLACSSITWIIASAAEGSWQVPCLPRGLFVIVEEEDRKVPGAGGQAGTRASNPSQRKLQDVGRIPRRINEPKFPQPPLASRAQPLYAGSWETVVMFCDFWWGGVG